MKLHADKHRVRPGRGVRLSQFEPDHTDGLEKEQVTAWLDERLRRLFDLQEKLYADRQHAILISLQGMDASGKDGVIGHVMRGLNPQGTWVVPFKAPSEEDLAHDFLW